MSAKSVAEVMTQNPVAMQQTSMLAEAAQAMRDSNIGDVLVMDDGKVCGIVTDRDIVVRGIAAGKDPKSTTLQDICSSDIVTIEPETKLGEAIQLMRDKAIRRLPVVENDKPVGMISLGDLAIERDAKSALADISEAPANR